VLSSLTQELTITENDGPVGEAEGAS